MHVLMNNAYVGGLLTRGLFSPSTLVLVECVSKVAFTYIQFIDQDNITRLVAQIQYTDSVSSE